MNKRIIQEFIYYKKSRGEIKNQEDFALKIGYMSLSSFSQALRKDPMPNKLVNKIKNVYPEFEDWRRNQFDLISTNLDKQKEFEDMAISDRLIELYKQNEDIKVVLENLTIKQNISNRSNSLYLKSIMEFIGLNIEVLNKDIDKNDSITESKS